VLIVVILNVAAPVLTTLKSLFLSIRQLSFHSRQITRLFLLKNEGNFYIIYIINKTLYLIFILQHT
jgi:hypothetical protein